MIDQRVEKNTLTKGQGAKIGPDTGQNPEAKKGQYSRGQSHTVGQGQDLESPKGRKKRSTNIDQSPRNEIQSINHTPSITGNLITTPHQQERKAVLGMHPDPK